MSGFSSDWLKLRESADHRARSRELLAKLAAHFAGRETILVVDLGTGTGSNLRAIAPHLPTRQQWTLVDHDPALLTAACDNIAEWADSSRPTVTGIEASKDGRSILVELKRADLAADPAAWGSAVPDLMTAAALFDLVSEEWIDRFVAALARLRLPFYTALTHSHVAEWSPPHPSDDAMTSAFESHFGSDKGFGPSAGSRATELLAKKLSAAGYETESAPSSWKLGRVDAALIATLADGWADAVRETKQVPPTTIADWLAARKSPSVSCVVGHEDLLALPR
jgi:hypothetical protein